MKLDFMVTNGLVFDGSGGAAQRVDLGVVGDCIVAVGDLCGVESDEVFDASGMLVCPGFIDTHTHSDTFVLIEPSAASKVFQGVTTEVCGNCGASAAPLLGSYRLPADWESKTYVDSWKSVADYRALVDALRPALNIALLVGHNTLHAGICGYEPRGANARELREMKRELERALDEGALGLSSGLAYPPGSAVPADELVELCGVVKKYGGVYTTHMRSESGGLLEAIDESIYISEQSGARLHISHLKASGKENWNLLERALEKVHVAGANADRYPYTAGSTDLDILLPKWASYGGRAAILERIRTEKSRKKIRGELMAKPSDYWDNVMIGSTQFDDFKGRYLPEVATILKKNNVDAFLHLIDVDELETGGIFFSMSEENLWQVLREPWVSIGSDASLRAPTGVLSNDHPHPRAYGSHVRFLRAALDGKTVELPEAIRKMTSLPAAQFNLKKRGQLKAGFFADIAVFDPAELVEKGTYAQPHQLACGLQHLWVNGVLTISDSIQTSKTGGCFLG